MCRHGSHRSPGPDSSPPIFPTDYAAVPERPSARSNELSTPGSASPNGTTGSRHHDLQPAPSPRVLADLISPSPMARAPLRSVLLLEVQPPLSRHSRGGAGYSDFGLGWWGAARAWR